MHPEGTMAPVFPFILLFFSPSLFIFLAYLEHKLVQKVFPVFKTLL